MLFGCSSEARKVEVAITLGYESDAIQAAPAVAQVEVQALAGDGSLIVSSSAEPGGRFELGELPRDTFLSLELSGKSLDGETQVLGRSVGLLLAELASDAIPLFAQRKNSWARPPEGIEEGYRRASAAAVGERFLLLAAPLCSTETSAVL